MSRYKVDYDLGKMDSIEGYEKLDINPINANIGRCGNNQTIRVKDVFNYNSYKHKKIEYELGEIKK